MHNGTYESVIGRHGLVSDGLLLWKVCVQNVHNASEKLVDFHPHNPQTRRGKTLTPILLPTKPNLYTEVTRPLLADLSTLKKQSITDEKDEFSPSSTPPTITTTIYINRRGAAQ